ncbi:Ribonuclease [Musa troglodytarum]|uniref:Ribonuclease n=1 Tax=Musa troglodytarum TaxID=320322 RepID=A0A9E7KD51_9LILI|nr:Ribonuclease [Musa troglodytarum]
MIRLVLSFLLVFSVTATPSYDYFHLVLQWPGSFCNVNRCCRMSTGYPKKNFTIHGLWPAFHNGTFPSCDKNPPLPPASRYNESQMRPLKKMMIEHWHSFRCPSSDGHSFWRHEWEKHGTCSLSRFDQLSYFEAALKLKNKVDILLRLNKRNIFPDNDRYSSRRIFQIIRREVSYKPAMQCNTKSGKQQLYQIHICVNKQGKEFIDCKVRIKRKCTVSQIVFPRFPKFRYAKYPCLTS